MPGRPGPAWPVVPQQVLVRHPLGALLDDRLALFDGLLRLRGRRLGLPAGEGTGGGGTAHALENRNTKKPQKK